ncbi:unnamed protein product [Chironomus riparius]|uniref:Uncharacterized protein n=1 Tax=Chironomus riparius TaxID=315576 RepID=A0A9N9RQW1_9DIPT|nr:unnamed protein product [Chironomus riparius]
MDLKFLALIIVWINFSSTSAADEVLECEYYTQKDSYICKLLIFNPNGLNNFTNINGTHFTGFNSLDVQSIISTEVSSTVNIPGIICETFINLKRISYTINGIDEIGENSFKYCKNVESIILFSNKITKIHESAFSENSKLQILNLGQNEITVLPEKLFENQIDLVSLNLISNNLTDMPNRIFRTQKKLTELDLGRNQISSLRNDWFKELESLETLLLGVNIIEDLPVDVFNTLKLLTKINLGSNKIKIIKSSSFGNLLELINVNLEENEIEAIDEKFIDNTGVTTLILSMNKCSDRVIADSTPSRTTMKNLLKKCFENYEKLIKIDSNGFNWWCLTVSNTGTGFFTDIEGTHVDGSQDSDVLEVTATPLSNSGTIPSAICAKFPNIGKTTYISIGLENIDRSAFRGCKYIKQINLSDNEISNIDELAFSKNGELQRLYLTKNRISSLPSNVFEKLVALRHLDIGNNQIEILENEWFENLGSLQSLSLNSNIIKELPTGIFAPLSSLANLNLGRNQLEVLNSESFGDLTKLTIVDVRYNRLTAIDEKILDNAALANLAMDGNDCASDDFIGQESLKQELGTCFDNFNNIIVTTTDSTTADSTSDSTGSDETDSTTETTIGETTDSTTEVNTSDSTTDETTTEELIEETTPDSASGIMIGKIILIIGITIRFLLH